jgi:SAM-dependent methyltransferase
MPRRPRLFSTPNHEPALSRDARRASGVYYTAPEIVRQIVDLTLGPLVAREGPVRVLDPACGAGEFALEVLRRLRAAQGAETTRQAVFAMDIDAQAVATTRDRLQAVDCHFPSANVIIADALDEKRFDRASFDAVIGNPPYVNIRQLAKSKSRQEVEQLRRRFVSARGNSDLYILFIERAIELLKPGGRCGLIVPGKWATMDYARPCRELLLALTTIEHLIDYSDAKAFAGANVFPQVLVFQKQRPASQHIVQVRHFGSGEVAEIPQRSLTAGAIYLKPPLDVESRVGTQPLGDLADIACGTAGYVAEKIARRLRETQSSSTEAQEADFITSGNIDRYAIRVGDVRFMNRDYARPRLPLNAPELTPAKRRLFSSSKIVIAGMSRRLEAAWDAQGLALGVQVFAASESKVDPIYLLAVLNSKLLSYLFATRYAAKRLSGGYLAINKGQLTRLPIVMPRKCDRRARRLANLLSEMAAGWQATVDEQIDHHVYDLYQLDDAEIERVEAHFALPKTIAVPQTRAA